MSDITVKSPWNSHPVKVRSADAGRALRDGQNKVFYLIQDETDGWYASRTRTGGPSELNHYRNLPEPEPVADNAATLAPVDRTGAPPRNRSRLLILLAAALALGAVAAVGVRKYQARQMEQSQEAEMFTTPEPTD